MAEENQAGTAAEGTAEAAPKSYRERKRWLFLGLPFTFTVYNLRADMLTIEQGFFQKVENDCYMYKVQDVELTRSLLERMAGLGTITCYTGDTTHPKLMIEHIKHSREIKDFILRESEEARLRRRTVNMLDIGTGDMANVDEMHDFHDAPGFHGGV